MAKIVLAEDDTTCRILTAKMLEKLGHAVQACPHGRHAWETLDCNPDADLVVTDMLMPEWDGRTLILKLRGDPRFAHLPALIISGPVGPKEILDLLEDGANLFLPKPFSLAQLEESIGQCLAKGEHPEGGGEKEVVRKALETVRDLPPLSASADRLMELTGREDHTLAEVIQVVECDAALTMNVLKVVNSASFGLRRPVAQVGRALEYLGERMAVALSIGSGSGDLYHAPLLGYEGTRGQLWRHSLHVAIAAREMAARARSELAPGLAFTAGILHDAGKAVLSHFLKGSPPELLGRIARHQAHHYLEAERQYLGTDHCEMGLAIARHWRLPEPYRQAIRWHHEPSLAPEAWKPLAYAVHLANALAMMSGSGSGADCLQTPLDKGYQDWIALDKKSLQNLMLKAEMEVERFSEELGMKEESKP